jgi:ABC-2 type transport system permease protein
VRTCVRTEDTTAGPFAQDSGFDWKNLGVLLGWGAAGALIAVRRFRWDPGSNDRNH